MEILISAGLIAMGLIPKAVLEAAYFQDRKSAKRTVFILGISLGSLCLAFGISLLLDNMG